jgi:hypothetical protein
MKQIETSRNGILLTWQVTSSTTIYHSKAAIEKYGREPGENKTTNWS